MRPPIVTEITAARRLRRAFAGAVHLPGEGGYATGGSFLNFLADPRRTETAYTPANYELLRGHELLRELKATYDPDNVFRLNHNIPPATPVAVEAVEGAYV